MLNLFESPGRILVTGGSGFVGFHIAERLAPRYDVYYTYNRHKVNIEHASGFHLRLESEPRMCQLISEFKPSVVVHAAGIMDRAFCEQDWERAYSINVRATQELYELAAKAQARMVFLSCAEVFDGDRGGYAETDGPFPRFRYAKTKSMAEENILEGRSRGHVVIRFSLPFGWGGAPSRGFVGNLVDTVRSGDVVFLRNDVTTNPVYLGDVVSAVEKAIKQKEGGLYHLGGNATLPEFEFGRLCARHFGLDEDLIQPYSSPEEDPSGRPAGDFSLDTRKMVRQFDWRPTPLEEGLRLTKGQIDRSASTRAGSTSD
jgi:dTDP-4-dehydrorhamnose reductase